MKSRISHFVLLLFVLGSASFVNCSGRKTSHLVPDSCRSIVRIDLPSLATKLFMHQELLDSIKSQTGFALPDMGLDLFQNAWVFERGTDAGPVPCLLFGLSDSDKFTNALKTKWPDLKIETLENVHVAWFRRFCLVWDEKFAIGQYFNPMLTPRIDPKPMMEMLKADLSADRSFDLPDSGDFAFRWLVGEAAPMALLPPFECAIRGTALLQDFNVTLQAQIQEHQYFAFLESFPTQPSSIPFNGVKMSFLPALKPIWQQYTALQKSTTSDVDDEMSSVVEALGDVDQPYTLFVPEYGIDDPMHTFEFWAHFRNESTARMLHQNMSSQLDPFLRLNRDSLSHRGHEISLHPWGKKPIFWSQSAQSEGIAPLFPDNLFSLELKNEKARLDIELAKTGRDLYKMGVKATDFHKLRLPQLLGRLEKGMAGFVPPILP